MYNFWQALPGQQQTVPRAELYALLLSVLHVEVDGVIDFFTDSLITANTFNKCPDRAKFANDADLWCQLFQHISIKNLLVRMYWMPSHTDTNLAKKKKAPPWMQEWHVKGNNAADNCANDGAAFHAIPEDKAKPVLDKLKNLMLVQSRIIHAIKMYPQRKCNKKPLLEQPTRLQKVEEAVWQSKQSLVLEGSRVCCIKCHASVPIKASHAFDFIGSSCLTEEKYMSFALGNLHTHPSHHVVLYGGVLLCRQCGSTGVNKAINLNRP